MATISKKRQQQKRQAIIRLVVMAGILLCVNILASYFRSGIDLTEEKRFTLSQPTKKLLRNLHETVVVDVYLKGKFPAGMQRLQEAVRERLQSFKDQAGGHIIFRFSDPFEGKNEQEQKQIFQTLAQKGIVGIPLTVKTEEESSQQIFFPYALVQYQGREKAVTLIEEPPGYSPMDQLNYSESLLEYKFASAINDLQQADRPRVAYMVGNGEPLNILTYDMLTTIPQYYHLDTFDLTRGIQVPLAYDVIIINKPVVPFSEPEKLKIDQYVMRGGKVLWAVNTLNTSMDSLVHSPQFLAMDLGLNLDDQLFKYGVRINTDLIEDKNCIDLPRTMDVNGQVQTDLRPWPYFPIVDPVSKNPIVRNMGLLLDRFSNTIDTNTDPNIKKTVLLHSSKYSRNAIAPVRVSVSMMSFDLPEDVFNKPYKSIAVLLDGKFHSLFQNRLAKSYLQILDSLKQPFKPECDSNNSMIVVSDGDIFANDYSPTDGPYPLGYWRFTKSFFSNKAFLLNCLEYLTDKSGLVEVRSKDLKPRFLDTGRVKKEKVQWQVINIGIPIALVLIFASCYLFFRKRRYENVPENAPANKS